MNGEGKQCQTDIDLSAAMLATQKFWFQPPVKYDPEWTTYLEQYKAQVQVWPHVPHPKEDLIKSILATNDSAPGPDGIPYAAWRLHRATSAEAMTTHFDDICRSAVRPCSVQAWIPKAKMGPTADNFRPLGMPSTFERAIDGSIATVMTKAIAPLLRLAFVQKVFPKSSRMDSSQRIWRNADYQPESHAKANHRLALFASPAHSVVQRSLANNCLSYPWISTKAHILALIVMMSIFINNVQPS